MDNSRGKIEHLLAFDKHHIVRLSLEGQVVFKVKLAQFKIIFFEISDHSIACLF